MTPLFTASQCQEAAGPASGDDGDPDFPRPEQLHALSTLLLAPTARRLSASGKPSLSAAARSAARSNAAAALRELLVEGRRAIQHGRLENLVAQALTLQKTKCIYHNTAEKIDLTEDHSCQLKMLPQVSTHVLEDHTDEVWCCRFSNGGRMLATSSADAVLILWDVGSGGGGNEGGAGGRGGTCSISLHQRIQVRDGAPQVLVWSPDDRWLLTCGGSSEVTRWDAASGSEARCYSGEHTEDVTEVAWLRDGRGFVSAGLDRSVHRSGVVELGNWWSGALAGSCFPFGTAAPASPASWRGGGRESPRFTPRRKSGGCCSIKEGEHETFEGNIISGVCSPRDGSHHLLLHMDRARIWSWDPVTKKILEKYEGHHQNRYIVRSTFGGLDDRFVASGSEDSMVYIWHRKRGELIGSLDGHAGTVNSVHWNPSRPGMLASVCDDQTVRIWEPPRTKPEQPPLPPSPPGDASASASAAATPGDAAGCSSGCGGEGAIRGVGVRFGSGSGIGSGSGSGSGGGVEALSPGSSNSSGEQRQRGGGGERGGGASRVKVKTELEVTEGGREGGSGSRSSGKGKGKGGRRSSVGVKGVKMEGGRRWGYGLGHPAAAGQGWVGDGGGGEGDHDSGYSARIAALRW
ncbi:unnamed protein product [Ectocarpus sp. 12 AP-2014]